MIALSRIADGAMRRSRVRYAGRIGQSLHNGLRFPLVYGTEYASIPHFEVLRHSEGDMPQVFRNSRLKVAALPKPALFITTLRGTSV